MPGLVVSGFWLQTIPGGPGKTALVQGRKSLSVAVFAPALARVAWRGGCVNLHDGLALALTAALALHVAAALKHHWIDRDATLLRILGRTHGIEPWDRAMGLASLAAACGLALLSVAAFAALDPDLDAVTGDRGGEFATVRSQSRRSSRAIRRVLRTTPDGRCAA